MSEEFECTKDYSLFKSTVNRDVLKNHVNDLSMFFLEDPHFLKRCPIFVSKDFIVIDGQHRLAAAKKTNSPVYFLKDDRDLNEKEIQNEIVKRNTKQKSWKAADYVKYYSDLRYETYVFIQDCINKQNFIKISQILCLLSLSENKTKFNKMFKQGLLNIEKQKLNYLKNFILFYIDQINKLDCPSKTKIFLSSNSYCMFLFKIYKNEQKKLEKFFETLAKHWTCLCAASNINQAEECFNYILKKKHAPKRFY